MRSGARGYRGGMSPFMSFLRRSRRTIAATMAVSGLMVPAVAAGPVSAAGATSLYSYDLTRASGTVANRAAANTGVTLRLQGNWWSNAAGAHFNGDTSSKRSVGHARPGDRPTIDVAGSAAVGAAVVFTWNPGSASCPNDSQNVMQVGPYASGVAQFKLQLGRCRSGAVKPQCRVAGAATPSGAAPVTGSGSIVPGRQYRLECVKAPDRSGGATLTIRLTDLSSGSTKVREVTIPRTGRVRSSKHLSVANKYPMPSYARNTDQFVGSVRRVAMCTGDSASAVRSCLGAAAPG
jgi:hypothetical protein